MVPHEGGGRFKKGLYISGEESLQQVKDRAHRLKLKAPDLSPVGSGIGEGSPDASIALPPVGVEVDGTRRRARRSDGGQFDGSVGRAFADAAADWRQIGGLHEIAHGRRAA